VPHVSLHNTYRQPQLIPGRPIFKSNEIAWNSKLPTRHIPYVRESPGSPHTLPLPGRRLKPLPRWTDMCCRCSISRLCCCPISHLQVSKLFYNTYGAQGWIDTMKKRRIERKANSKGDKSRRLSRVQKPVEVTGRNISKSLIFQASPMVRTHPRTLREPPKQPQPPASWQQRT